MKYKIQYLPPSQLKPNPDNPRLIKDANFKKLVKSLKDCPELFDARPCICSNRTGELVILGGNMRFRASLELKYDKIPTVVMEGLTVEQEREIVIRDNGTWGEFDWDILANNWSDLPLAEWGVDLPPQWMKDDNGGGDDIVPDKDPNVLVRLSFHPGMWLGKREEIMGIFERIKKTYECTVKVEE